MRAEIDAGQDTTNPHIRAARIIKRKGPITHHDINAVLGLAGHTVTSSELLELKSLTYTEYSMRNLAGVFKIASAYFAFNLIYPKNPKTGQGK